MSRPCLNLDTEDHHTGFSRAHRPAELELHLGDQVDVLDTRYDIQTSATVTGFDGEADEYVLVRVEWEYLDLDIPIPV